MKAINCVFCLILCNNGKKELFRKHLSIFKVSLEKDRAMSKENTEWVSWKLRKHARSPILMRFFKANTTKRSIAFDPHSLTIRQTKVIMRAIHLTSTSTVFIKIQPAPCVNKTATLKLSYFLWF